MAAATQQATGKIKRAPSKRKRHGRRWWWLAGVTLALSVGAALVLHLRPEWLQALRVAAGVAQPPKPTARPRKASARSRSAGTRLFERAVVPLVRDYVFAHYGDFAASRLTFRDLKTHLAESMHVPYEELQTDELSEVIEDAVDVIANKCDGGQTPAEDCATALGFDLAGL
eukprot:scaffold13369_cov112-Isochrysis_galbana.AAC.3